MRLEPLEQRALLSATIATDQPDYAPGATAMIHGTGFRPGETVQLQVLHADGTPALGSNPWQVTDGDNSFVETYQDGNGIWHSPDLDGQTDGKLQTTWYVDGTDETNATMQLTATGLSSAEMAQTTFTDAATMTNIGVAHDTGSTGRTTLSTSVTAAVAVGKTMIVSVALNTGSSGAVTIADNAAGGSNVYTKNVDVVNASGVRLLVFTAPVARALAVGNTVTATTPTGISDKSMQVSSGNVVFEASTARTGSDTYPTSDPVTASVVGASYRIVGVDAAVSRGSESIYNSSYWSSLGSDQSAPGTATNTIVYGASFGAVGAAGMKFLSDSYPQFNIFGQLSESGNWAATIMSMREVIPLTSTIAFPVNGTSYTAGTWTGQNINGTAADTTGGAVNQVKLSIRDTTANPNTYFNGSSWVTTSSTQVTATGTTSWSYASLTTARLTEGHNYTITSFSSGPSGTQFPGTTSSFTYADVTAPTVNLVIVTPPPSSYFLGAGSTLQITVQFSENVNVTGTPRLQLNTTPTAYATYASGSGTTQLKFNYTVAAGQNSPLLDYPASNALTLNGGTIRDAANNNANLTLQGDNLGYQNIVVDTTVPVVSSVTVSPSPTGTAPTISAGLTDVNSAATSRIAAGEYFVDALGAAGTGTSLSLSPTNNSTCTGGAVVSGFAGLSDGAHTVYVRAKDSAGNWSVAANASFVKDAAMPAVTLTAPASPTNQDPIPFTVTFTQNVTGLSMEDFAATNGAVVGLSGSDASYTVLVDPAASGVVTCQVLGNAAENAAVPGKFNTPSNVASVTYDGTAPTLSSLSLQYQSAGAYMKAGSYVTLGLTFSEVVYVTGTPQLRLNTGATVNYSSGSGTTTLSFGMYTVAAGQNAAPLDFASDGAVVGAIKDAAGNAVVAPTPGPTSLLYAKNLKVDTTAPTATVTPTGTATNTSPILFAINFSETLKSSPALTSASFIATGGTLGALSGSGTAYTIPVTPTGQGAVTLALKANVVQDLAGNSNTASNTASVIYDTVAPTVADILVGYGQNKWYSLKNNPGGRTILPWQITAVKYVFSENVLNVGLSSLATTGFTVASVSGAGTTWQWNVSGAGLTQGKNFSMSLNGGITDAAINALAGTSLMSFKVLYGDVTGDGYVSAADLVAANNARANFNMFADIDGNGVVDVTDVNLVRSKVGTYLP